MAAFLNPAETEWLVYGTAPLAVDIKLAPSLLNPPTNSPVPLFIACCVFSAPPPRPPSSFGDVRVVYVLLDSSRGVSST